MDRSQPTNSPTRNPEGVEPDEPQADAVSGLQSIQRQDVPLQGSAHRRRPKNSPEATHMSSPGAIGSGQRRLAHGMAVTYGALAVNVVLVDLAALMRREREGR